MVTAIFQSYIKITVIHLSVSVVAFVGEIENCSLKDRYLDDNLKGFNLECSNFFTLTTFSSFPLLQFHLARLKWLDQLWI